jgi:hypothetical protein
MNHLSSPMNAVTLTSRPAVKVSSKGTALQPAHVGYSLQHKNFSPVAPRNRFAEFQFPGGTTNPSLSSDGAQLTRVPSSVGALFYKKSPLTPSSAASASATQARRVSCFNSLSPT